MVTSLCHFYCFLLLLLKKKQKSHKQKFATLLYSTAEQFNSNSIAIQTNFAVIPSTVFCLSACLRKYMSVTISA